MLLLVVKNAYANQKYSSFKAFIGELNITVGVNEQDYEKAVRAAHREFFRAEHTA